MDWSATLLVLTFFGTIALLILMSGHLIESRLLRRDSRVLSVLLPTVSAVVAVYGLLRGTGMLLYASDRYTRDSLLFDYSNQKTGYTLLFLFAPLLLGAIIALVRRKESVST